MRTISGIDTLRYCWAPVGPNGNGRLSCRTKSLPNGLFVRWPWYYIESWGGQWVHSYDISFQQTTNKCSMVWRWYLRTRGLWILSQGWWWKLGIPKPTARCMSTPVLHKYPSSSPHPLMSRQSRRSQEFSSSSERDNVPRCHDDFPGTWQNDLSSRACRKKKASCSSAIPGSKNAANPDDLFKGIFVSF